jgi:predicted hydrolase (HD superfamily)
VKTAANRLKEYKHLPWICQVIFAPGGMSKLQREGILARMLYYRDQFCGFLTARACVYPCYKIAQVEVKSVSMKPKDNSFSPQEESH